MLHIDRTAPWRQPRPIELIVTLQLELAELGLRRIPGKSRLSLGERGKKRGIVKRDQQVSFADELTLPVMHFLDDAGGLRFDGDRLERLARANGVQLDGNRAPLDFRDDYRNSRSVLGSRKHTTGARSLSGPWAVRAADQNEREE